MIDDRDICADLGVAYQGHPYVRLRRLVSGDSIRLVGGKTVIVVGAWSSDNNGPPVIAPMIEANNRHARRAAKAKARRWR